LNSQPIAAVAALVRRDERILLVKRRHPPNQDLWVLPGGKIQWGETAVQALEREIMEECGICIDIQQPLQILDLINTKNTPHYHYVIIDYDAHYVEGELRAGSDALEAEWVTQTQWAELPLEHHTRELLQRLFC